MMQQYIRRGLSTLKQHAPSLSSGWTMERDDDDYTPWAPHPKTIIRLGWTTAALGLLVAIVSAIGEIRGWWGLLGQLGMTIGTLVSILIAIATGTYASSKHQAEQLLTLNRSHSERLTSVDESLISLSEGFASMDGNVVSMGESVSSMGESVSSMGQSVSSMDEGIASMERKLDGVEQAITEGVIRELDAVEIQLDKQTGVLDRQLDVLERIQESL